jgi:hypothetical protein
MTVDVWMPYDLMVSAIVEQRAAERSEKKWSSSGAIFRIADVSRTTVPQCQYLTLMTSGQDLDLSRESSALQHASGF